MSERMPDFAMPSDEEVARQRAEAEDAAREAAMRAELGLAGDADAQPSAVRRDEPDATRRDEADAAERPVTRRRRALALARNPLVAFVVGAGLVAAAFVAVPAIQRQSEAGSLAELQRVADAYVQALETGDLETATRMAPPDDEYGDVSLLDVAPVEGASYECREPSVDDDVATVSCAVTVPGLGASSAPLRMRLVRGDAGWGIETGLAVASPLFVALAEVDGIAGEPLPDGLAIGEDPLWLYPGSYELDVTTSPRLDVVDRTLAVLGDGFFWFGGAQPGAEMRDELQAAAVDYVAACAETAAVGCPAVEPLAPGERLEAVSDGYSSSIGERDLVMGVLVRRIGGAPDQWTIEVRAVFADDLQSYVVVPSIPAF
ncbi:hypothetical protein [Agrococcus sp. SGAir0287]|uniref:hypothetical protein n=1 Tax=Agrococcus sp. SGAir0287 TaxID=2070347 RepID=UPI0010CD280D|nr:hypothetical protein [Agrococcus sp. SGAir0287]QCR18496.1 hypothetical protein C1N71_02710 [Agrococcus sp. SGAir0287]